MSIRKFASSTIGRSLLKIPRQKVHQVNVALDHMLVDRPMMSRKARLEVSAKSENWDYSLGPVYIRKIHFCDPHRAASTDRTGSAGGWRSTLNRKAE